MKYFKTLTEDNWRALSQYSTFVAKCLSGSEIHILWWVLLTWRLGKLPFMFKIVEERNICNMWSLLSLKPIKETDVYQKLSFHNKERLRGIWFSCPDEHASGPIHKMTVIFERFQKIYVIGTALISFSITDVSAMTLESRVAKSFVLINISSTFSWRIKML